MSRILSRFAVVAMLAPVALAQAHSGHAATDLLVGDSDLSIPAQTKTAPQSLMLIDQPVENEANIGVAVSTEEVQEVSVPKFSHEQIMQFGTALSPWVMTFSLAEYDDGLQKMKPAFAHPEGWKSFEDALNGLGIPSFLRQYGASATSVMNGDISVVPLDEAVPSWELVAPLKITYANSTASSSEDLILRMKLIASVNSENPVVWQVIVQRP